MRQATNGVHVFLLLAVAGTATLTAQTWEDKRPLPHPIVFPAEFQRAIDNGTRTVTGEPGPNYWQQWANYTIEARLLPEEKRVEGTEEIVFYNNSLSPIPVVALYLVQNVYAEGAMRNRPSEVTGGFQISRVAVNGEEVGEIQPRQRGAGYATQGTNFIIRLPEPLSSGDSIRFGLDWSFKVPQSGRQGWNADNLFFIAYWYPQMAVFDDIDHWQTDQFLGSGEFYTGFGSYDVTIDAPDGWLILATGTLQNPDEVFPAPVLERYRRAHESDDVVHVITAEDFGPGTATRTSDTGTLRWHFQADSVRDFVWSASTESLWDAARIPVGDRNGDGRTDYARGDAIYRQEATRWQHAWRYVQHSIDHHSRFTGISYPWPHMTAVEGGGIMGGGMEYPMMTLISPFTEAGDTLLYLVTTHELAHMWVPMIVSTDERRYGWMDEGTTDFNEIEATKEFYPDLEPERTEQNSYLGVARAGREGEMMRLTDYHYPGPAMGVASYQKPATMLIALRELVGEETFIPAYRAYLRNWRYKHPMPWDFFNSFNHLTGQDLDWFWSTWYYETWTLDHAVGSVHQTDDGTTIVIEDKGLAYMPARVTITRENGELIEREVPVDYWLEGNTSAEITVPTGSPVVKVEIDTSGRFPDIDRENNTWERRT